MDDFTHADPESDLMSDDLIAEMLLSSEPNATRTDHEGNCYLHYALRGRNDIMTLILTDEVAEDMGGWYQPGLAETRNRQGESPLDWLVDGGGPGGG
jgi:hypothetical protein